MADLLSFDFLNVNNHKKIKFLWTIFPWEDYPLFVTIARLLSFFFHLLTFSTHDIVQFL